MKKLGFGLALVAWMVVAFLVTVRLTFPSDPLIERAQYEVDRATNGDYVLQIGSVVPWWAGMKAHDVTLLSTAGGAEAGAVLDADVARIRVAPFSLLGNPKIAGGVSMGGGDVYFVVELSSDDDGRYALEDLDLSADDYPIAAIPAVQGSRVMGTGDVDVEIDIGAAGGLRKANGVARIQGRDLIIEELSGVGALLSGFLGEDTFPVRIGELDLRVEISDGRARVVRGYLDSTLITAELSGDIVLQNRPERSRTRLKAVLDVGEDGASLEPFLGSAKWSDDRYHYRIDGTLGSPRARPDRERTRRGSRDRPTTSRRSPGRDEPASRRPSPETLEEIRRAREERRRERMEERRSRLEGTDERVGPRTRRAPGDEDLEIIDGEELPPKDELATDEEYLEEEGYLDDEELPPDEDLPPDDDLPPDERLRPDEDY